MVNRQIKISNFNHFFAQRAIWYIYYQLFSFMWYTYGKNGVQLTAPWNPNV